MSDYILLSQSEAEEVFTPSEVKLTKGHRSNGTKRHFSGAEYDSTKRGSSLSEIRPAKRQKNSEIEKYTSRAGNDSLSIAPNDVEFEMEKARFDIFKRFMNIKMKMDKDEEMMTKEMEFWTQGGLANLNGGKNPQNEFFIKSLIDNFEEIIGNIGQESKKDMNHTMDDIRKILIKLIGRIEQGFRPKVDIDAVKVTRKDTVHFLWLSILSLVAVLIGVFPDYALKYFESSVAFFQSTLLIFFLLCMLYFYNPSSK